MTNSTKCLAVVGVGQMGKAIALYAMRHLGFDRIVLLDSNPKALDETGAWLQAHCGHQSAAIECAALDVFAAASLPAAVAEAQVFALALPWPQTRRFLEISSSHPAAVVSITRPAYADIEQLQSDTWIGSRAVLLPMGLEPGLTEIIACDLASRFNDVEEMTIRCGGIPMEHVPPLGYKLLFDGALPLRPRPAFAVVDHQLRDLRRFSEVETFTVPGIGELEAHLDGMVPWLPSSPALKGIKRLMQKTVRRVGFTAKVNVLEDLGLLDADAFNQTEKAIRARIPQVACDDATVLDFALSAPGRERSRSLRWTLVDKSDAETGLTSLARLTGFSAAIALETLQSHAPHARGWIQPQALFRGDLVADLLQGLAREGIQART